MNIERVKPCVMLLLAVLLSACAGSHAHGPEEIMLGVDVCEYCHMAIDAPDRAAEWVAGGHVHKFDEPGCLLAWLQGRVGAEGTGYVADLEGSGWVPVERSTLLLGGLATSMGFDIVAFRDAGSAERRAAGQGGVIRTWQQLREEGVQDAHAN